MNACDRQSGGLHIMIRIPRTELDYAVATLVACAKNARDARGLRIMFPLNGDQAERAILAALATLAPGTIPQVVMPADVHEIEHTSAAGEEPRAWADRRERELNEAAFGQLAHGRSEGEGLTLAGQAALPLGDKREAAHEAQVTSKAPPSSHGD
jgi:hypothetical protein